jgi:hypothetical protein
MITITHEKATFIVKPENAEPTRELLALINKSKGKKGRKFSKYQIDDDGKRRIVGPGSMSRFYPVFAPGMTTAEYVKLYALQNDRLHLAKVKYTHADRPAAMLDPTIPEVVEVTCEQ